MADDDPTGAAVPAWVVSIVSALVTAVAAGSGPALASHEKPTAIAPTTRCALRRLPREEIRVFMLRVESVTRPLEASGFGSKEVLVDTGYLSTRCYLEVIPIAFCPLGLLLRRGNKGGHSRRALGDDDARDKDTTNRMLRG